MNTTPDAVTLLTARTDGSIIVGIDGSPPTTAHAPGTVDAALHRMEEALGLDHDGTHLAVTDTTGDGRVHHVAWHGPLPSSWAPPGTWRCAPFGQILTAMPTEVARRLRAAARTGLLGDPASHLTDGLRPGARPAKSERAAARFTWHPRTPNAHEEEAVRQVWGWLTDPQGRVLVVLDHNLAPGLPGGRPEPGESPDATLAREAMEEASAKHGPPTVVGFQKVTTPGHRPYLQLRMTAPLRELGPAAPDPDTGEIYRRVLVPAAHANLLLGWGPEGDAQATAIALNFPRTRDRALQHVPEQGWVPKGAGAGEVS